MKKPVVYNSHYLDKALTKTEKELVRNYKASLKKIKGQLDKYYSKYSIDGVLSYAEMTKYNRLNGLFEQVNGEIYSLTGKNARLTQRLSGEMYNEGFFRHGFNIENQLVARTGSGVALSWGKFNPATIKAAVENPLSKIAFDDLKKSMLTKARRTITQGLIEGQSYHKMAKQLQKDFEGKTGNSLTIARTEAGKAHSMGQLAAYDKVEQAGVIAQKVWVSSLDNRTRESHQYMDGKKAGKDGMFTLKGGIKMPAPRIDGPAHEVVNCRCRVVMHVEGYEPDSRVARDIETGKNKKIEHKTYKEWAAEHGHKATGPDEKPEFL